ncbi:hypothetical protein [Micromonospora carbonacea]|uniref:hypothetical protein n=1 Tax=Micromonospora carbonacea TaxID=47853 RepID=UPI0037173495
MTNTRLWLRDNSPRIAALTVLYLAMATLLALWAWIVHPPTWAIVLTYTVATALFGHHAYRRNRARQVAQGAPRSGSTP